MDIDTSIEKRAQRVSYDADYMYSVDNLIVQEIFENQFKKNADQLGRLVRIRLLASGKNLTI